MCESVTKSLQLTSESEGTRSPDKHRYGFEGLNNDPPANSSDIADLVKHSEKKTTSEELDNEVKDWIREFDRTANNFWSQSQHPDVSPIVPGKNGQIDKVLLSCLNPQSKPRLERSKPIAIANRSQKPDERGSSPDVSVAGTEAQAPRPDVWGRQKWQPAEFGGRFTPDDISSSGSENAAETHEPYEQDFMFYCDKLE